MLRPASGQILLDLSNMLLDVGEIRLAVASLRRLTQSEPANVKAWQNLAIAECARGRYDRGISASLYALELDPANIAVRHNLALAYMQAGELEYAREELADALILCPRDRVLKRLQFRLRLLRLMHALWRC
jgi:tetratricopeptide (TPR) repeat protein